MKIQIDVDGVLADFLWGAYTIAHSFDSSVVIKSTIESKDWNNWDGLDRSIINKVWEEIKTRPYFFCDLKPLITPEEMRMLSRLHVSGNEIYFVTARPGKTSKWQTEQWLWDKLNVSATVIMTPDKAGFSKLIHPDWSIEDNAMNAYKIGLNIGPTHSFILDRLYNKELHCMSAKRVGTVKEFLEAIQ